MKFRAALRATIKALPFGVALGCLVGSLALTLATLVTEAAPWRQWLLAPLGAIVAALFAAGFAVVPVLALGLPGYTWLLSSGHATRGSASVAGALLGGVVGCWAGWQMALLTAGYGLCIGYFTHEAQRAGSNNSSKPTPLRGAA